MACRFLSTTPARLLPKSNLLKARSFEDALTRKDLVGWNGDLWFAAGFSLTALFAGQQAKDEAVAAPAAK